LSSSLMGRGGALRKDGWGLFGRERERDLDDLRRASGIPKRFWSFLVADVLGVDGTDVEGCVFSRTLDDAVEVVVVVGVGGSLRALGFAGVAVELVAVVVEERGRDGIRDVGLVPLAVLTGVGNLLL